MGEKMEGCCLMYLEALDCLKGGFRRRVEELALLDQFVELLQHGCGIDRRHVEVVS